MSTKDLEKTLARKMKERQIKSLEQEDYRAQSLTVGSSGGGVTEITMRGVTNGFLWCIYQPVEVVELINQLAASIGCHIHIQPRNDFASWRQWNNISDEERLHLNGFPPFADRTGLNNRAGTGITQETKLKLQNDTNVKEKENVATKKAVNKRSTKRSRTAAK